MTELTFTKVGTRYISDPVEVTSDFIAHLKFSAGNASNNVITIRRSVTGTDYVPAWSTAYDEVTFERTFTGVGSGLNVVVATANEPAEGFIA